MPELSRLVQPGRDRSARAGACSITRATAPGRLLAGTSQAIGVAAALARRSRSVILQSGWGWFRRGSSFRARLDDLSRGGVASSSCGVRLLAAADEASELAIVLRASPDLELPLDALDPAERAGLIETQEGRISFRHPLVRSVVYRPRPPASVGVLMPPWPTRAAAINRQIGDSGIERLRRSPRTRTSLPSSKRPPSARSAAADMPRRRPRSSAPRSSARPRHREAGAYPALRTPPTLRDRWNGPATS